jgi:hypothetical protein
LVCACVCSIMSGGLRLLHINEWNICGGCCLQFKQKFMESASRHPIRLLHHSYQLHGLRTNTYYQYRVKQSMAEIERSSSIIFSKVSNCLYLVWSFGIFSVVMAMNVVWNFVQCVELLVQSNPRARYYTGLCNNLCPMAR